jgi:pyruvate formate lyase activating enzyme
MSHGLRHVYTGNVHDPEGQTTTCPDCGTAVVVRDWYAMRAYRLDDRGACLHCGYTLPGRYDGPVGTWGARRLPVIVGAG